MLCPQCGKEVGDQPALCEECQEAKARAKAAKEAPPVQASSAEPENLPALNNAPKKKKKPQPPQEQRTADKSNSNPVRVIVLVMALFFGIIALYILFGGNSQPENPPKSQPGAVPTPSPSDTKGPSTTASPMASGAASPAPSGAATAGTDPAHAAKEIALADTSWKESLAVWDRQKNEVSLGLYKEPLSEKDRNELKESGDLPRKESSFVLTFLLEPGAETFNSANAKSVKAGYYSADSGPDVLTFSYVVGKKELPVAAALSGALAEGGTIEGTSKQVAEKLLDSGKKIKLGWDLKFKAPIVFVGKAAATASPQPSAGASAAPSSKSPQVATVREGEYGTISSDGTDMGIKEAFALYYPETGSVSIGLYGQELDESDRAEIRKKKVVTSFVNGKRPSMVLALDFPKKGGEISKENLLGYTAYFYRDSSGVFFFPGNFDSKSVRRAPQEFQEKEFAELVGQLKDGAPLSIRTAGDNAPAPGGTKLGWKLGLKVTLNAVQ